MKSNAVLVSHISQLLATTWIGKKMSTAASRKGVLLINLGSPDNHSPGAIRRFLREFLSDPRVMDIPAPARWLILNLFILPFRPGKITHKYKRIWEADGFPLIKHGRKVVQKLSHIANGEYSIELAMRYGSPSIDQALNNLRASGMDELLVLPFFPQYASATTGSVLEKVFSIIKQWQVIPRTFCITSFYDQAGFIACWVKKGRPYLLQNPDHLLFSFHGLPESHILKSDRTAAHCLQDSACCQKITRLNSDCYRAQCYQTAKKIAEGLHIEESKYTVSFQSRLGRSQWIQPSTGSTVKQLAKKGVEHLLVFCPSFVADCLETIEEISVQERQNFLEFGGRTLTLVPSLNSEEDWIEVIRSMIESDP